MESVIICFLSLTVWLLIILFCAISFFKNVKEEIYKTNDIDREALLLVENDKKIRYIIALIKELDSDTDNEKNKIKSKILKTKLKLMVSNPVLRESIMRIKKIKKN